MEDDNIIIRMDAKKPHSELSIGITKKFIPKIPEISVGGKNAIEKTVNRFMIRFCSILIKPVMVS